MSWGEFLMDRQDLIVGLEEIVGPKNVLATEMDRTLFFDFLPLELGEVKGFKTRFHLYTVPGQVYYNARRKLILRGVDGLVFVAESPRRIEVEAARGIRSATRLRWAGVFANENN